MRLVCTVLALAAAALVVPSPARAGSACTLVTQSEASAALGVSVLPGLSRTDRRGESCRYYAPNHRSNVFVARRPNGDFTGIQQAGGKPVPGLSNAFFMGGSVFIQRGANVIQVGLIRSMDDMKHLSPALVTLARQAAGRM